MRAMRHFLVVVLGNYVAWRNNFLVKPIKNTLLMIDLRCLAFFGHGEDGLFYWDYVWFLRRNTKPRCRLLLQPSRQSVGLSWLHPSVPDTQTRHRFSSSVSNLSTNFVAIHQMFKFSLKICWKDLYERPNLPAISKIVLCRASLKTVRDFCKICFLRELWKKDLNAHTFNGSVRISERRKPLTSLLCSHGIVTESCCEHFVRFKCSFTAYEATQMLYSLKSAGSSEKLVTT